MHARAPAGGALAGAVRVEDEPLRPFFTPKTLAAYLALSERTVRAMIARGELPSYKVAGARRISPRDVDGWLAHRRQDAA
jgi:excisionase family DNA binding protein